MQVTETGRDHRPPDGLRAAVPVLDDIRGYGGEYTLDKFDLGYDKDDPSTVRMTVGADDDEESLQRLLMRIQTKGANLVDPGTPEITEVAHRRGVPGRLLLDHEPADQVRLGGHWVTVRNPEMDCGLLVEGDGRRCGPSRCPT